MFSDLDIPRGTDTIEYAWLMEIQCGHLKGKVTPLQVSEAKFKCLLLDTYIKCGIIISNVISVITLFRSNHHISFDYKIKIINVDFDS